MNWILDRLSEKRTWEGIFQLTGILTGGGIYLIDNNLGHALTGAVAGIGGGNAISAVIKIVTKDAKSTPNKWDDALNTGATAYLEKNQIK